MITLRLQKISDAERFYEILNNPNFIYFPVKPKSIEDEIKFLKWNKKLIEENSQWNYSILKNNKVIWAIGIKINNHRNFIWEIWYFIDEKYWWQWITTQAVKLIEDICINKLNLTRLEIYMMPENKASEKVAIKNNYHKEWLLKKVLKHQDWTKNDSFLYAKIVW